MSLRPELSLVRVVAGISLVLAATACPDTGGQAGASSTIAAANSGAAPSGSASAAAPALVDEASVKKVVDAWVLAQNKGDFAAYQKLYASKLEGVKRSGQKTWRFDRKGFLADRERMFKKPMTVEAKDVTVRASAASAVVELKQRFKQDKFEDEGPKRLVIVLEQGELRIAREEMLSSVVASAGSAGASKPLRFILDDAGKHYLFIDTGDAAWGTGPSQMMSKGLAGASFAAMRAAGKAPESASSWKGRAVQVYDASGKSCEATVRELALLAAGTPHFGEVQMWDGAVENGKPTMPVLGPAQRASAVLGMTTPYLVGELEVPAGCAPTVALEPKTPKFFVRTQVAADDGGSRAAQEAFKKLPSYTEAQQRFSTEFQGKGDWAKTITVQGFEGNSRRFIAVSAEEMASCGEFNASVSAIFEITGGSKAVLVAEGAGTPDALFDSDGDGKVELVVGNSYGGVRYLVQSGGNGELVTAASVDFPYNDCPC